jgi:hypothetical protein
VFQRTTALVGAPFRRIGPMDMETCERRSSRVSVSVKIHTLYSSVMIPCRLMGVRVGF